MPALYAGPKKIRSRVSVDLRPNWKGEGEEGTRTDQARLPVERTEGEGGRKTRRSTRSGRGTQSRKARAGKRMRRHTQETTKKKGSGGEEEGPSLPPLQRPGMNVAAAATAHA